MTTRDYFGELVSIGDRILYKVPTRFKWVCDDQWREDTISDIDRQGKVTLSDNTVLSDTIFLKGY